MKVVSRSIEEVDLLGHRPSLVWLTPDRSLVGFGEAVRFAAGIGPQRFGAAQRAFTQWCEQTETVDAVDQPGSGPIAFASFTFDDRSHGSVLIVPEVTLGIAEGRAFVTTVGDVDPAPYLDMPSASKIDVDRPRYAGASTPDLGYLDAVASAVTHIREGHLQKVVLARDHAVWSKRRFDVPMVLERLRIRYPECLVFSVDGLVGASPELLVRRVRGRIESLVLAGTAPRSDDPAEDARLAEELLSSEKVLVEHRWATHSVEATLRGLTDGLTSSERPELLELHGLRHVATRFTAPFDGRRTALEIAALLHPTGAVGGFPTAAAIDLIRRLEGMDRGRYAGPVGWTDHRGDGEFAIALRCAEISGARARLFAGAGIVADSLPESELEETRLKLAAMLGALDSPPATDG